MSGARWRCRGNVKLNVGEMWGFTLRLLLLLFSTSIGITIEFLIDRACSLEQFGSAVDLRHEARIGVTSFRCFSTQPKLVSSFLVEELRMVLCVKRPFVLLRLLDRLRGSYRIILQVLTLTPSFLLESINKNNSDCKLRIAYLSLRRWSAVRFRAEERTEALLRDL